jgi:hypothetical protein
VKACDGCGLTFTPPTERHRLCRSCRHSRKLERSRRSPSHKSRIRERLCSRCGAAYRRRADCLTCSDCDKAAEVDRVRAWTNKKRAEKGLPPVASRGIPGERADRVPCVVCGSEAMRWRRSYCAQCAEHRRIITRRESARRNTETGRKWRHAHRPEVLDRQWERRLRERFGGSLPQEPLLSMLAILRNICISNPSFRPIASGR